ncbi:MAG TPA: dTMP kinase [Thermotogota bacterium]|nr:dTMP kinase [Thermotogota bacterium]HPR95437.1 dTMP kinase [Thermotogota bacterium]
MSKLEQRLPNKDKRVKKGLFISFEGLDGCGKTTQIKLLMEQFKRAGKKPILFREPGCTNVGEALRQIVLHEDFSIGERTELLLYITARAQVTDEVIIPALERDEILIADRYADSSVAYQGFGRELGADKVEWLNDFAVKNVYPDLTVFLDVPSTEVIKRLDRDNLDRLEREKEPFFRRVREGYLWLAEKHSDRFIRFNALKAPGRIHEEIMDVLYRKGLFNSPD